MDTIKLADLLDSAERNPRWAVCGDTGVEGWLVVYRSRAIPGFPICAIRPHIGPGVPVDPASITLATCERGWRLVE